MGFKLVSFLLLLEYNPNDFDLQPTGRFAQLGNTVQLALAIARLVSGPDKGPFLLVGGQQALVSLLSFIAGSLIGRLAGNRTIKSPYGPKTRGWLVFATLVQALLTVFAAMCSKFCHQSGVTMMPRGPSWTGGYGLSALALLSASMGLQGSMATPIGAHIAKLVPPFLIYLVFRLPPNFECLNYQHTRGDSIMGMCFPQRMYLLPIPIPTHKGLPFIFFRSNWSMSPSFSAGDCTDYETSA